MRVREDKDRATPAQAVVLDDQPEVLKVTTDLLGIIGITTTGFTDCDEALDYLRGHMPDVVLLDLTMPHMSGLDVLAKLRRTHPSLRVVLMSGYAGPNVEDDNVRFLRKPFGLRELQRVVEEPSFSQRDANGKR